MPQPTIRAQQINSDDYDEIVGGALGATLIITSPIEGETLTFSGSPLAWRNAVGGGGAGSVVAGDGLDSTAGAGSPFSGTFSVDATVARTDITTETFTFAGDVSINLNDTSQSADEDIWRVSAAGSSFVISTRTDADGAGNPAITFARTGTTVDTATVPASTHLTSSGTGTSSALHISSNVPTLVINDNDAAANAGIWDITSGANVLDFRTRTDAHGTGITWLQVTRAGTAISSIAFTGNVQVYDTGGTDLADFNHDGTDFNIDHTSTTDLNITGLGGSPATGGVVVDGRGLIQGADDLGSKQVLRSIRFVVGPGSVAGTNLDVLAVDGDDGGFNQPFLSAADNMPVDSSSGSWQLDATGEGLRLILPHQVIGIINCSVTLAIWNGASTTTQYYITPEIYSGAGSPTNENGIQFLAFQQGLNSASSWPGTVTNTINDQVRFNISYISST